MKPIIQEAQEKRENVQRIRELSEILRVPERDVVEAVRRLHKEVHKNAK
jgi:Mn-dependent DtxR family transcriptional regulator